MGALRENTSTTWTLFFERPTRLSHKRVSVISKSELGVLPEQGARMAPSARGRNLKRYYKQSKKKSSGVGKSNGKKRGKKDDDNRGGVTKEEQLLKEFDMNMAYGPCLGLTRLARWKRAVSLGLNPPKDVEKLLREATDPALARCMWDGRFI